MILWDKQTAIEKNTFSSDKTRIRKSEEEFNFRRIIFNSSRFIAVEKATSGKK